MIDYRVKDLVAYWRKGPWLTHEEDTQLAYKEGILDCADELERALRLDDALAEEEARAEVVPK